MKITTHNIIPKPMSEFEVPNSDIWYKETCFESGNYYQIVAPSGTGKSSFVNIILGIRKDYNGEILFDNQNVAKFSLQDWTRIRTNVLSMVFQGLHLFPELTVMENIQLKNELTHHKNSAEIEEMVNRVGLSLHLHRKAEFLSYGQQQRIAVIRALCQPFQFLLLDEPFSHLDSQNIGILENLIVEEAQRQQAGIIITSLHPYSNSLFAQNVVRL